MTEPGVRRGRLEDVDAALLLFAKLDSFERDWRVFTPRSTAVGDTRERYRRLVVADDGILVVAEAGGRLVGLGTGRITKPSSWSDELALEVANVYVDTSFRRQGVGRAIVAKLVEFAFERGLERLVLRLFAPNRDAEAFWSKLGFEPRLIQFTARTDRLRDLGPHGD